MTRYRHQRLSAPWVRGGKESPYKPLTSDPGETIFETEPSSQKVTYPPETGFAPKAGGVETVPLRGNRIFVLKNVTVIPGGIIVHRGKVHRESFRIEKLGTSTRHLKFRRSGNRDRYRLSGKPWPEASREVDSAFFFDHEYVDEYGHFLVELMSRLWALEFCKDCGNLPFLASSFSQGFQAGLLGMVGIGPERLLVFPEAIKVRKLYVASQSVILDLGATPEAALVFNKLREAIPLVSGIDRVYLSRRKYPTRVGRRLVNEQEVAKVLETHGFSTFFPEELSVRDQMTLYRNASVLSGEAGTVMLNRVFQNRSGKELLLGPAGDIEPNHAILRSLMGLGNVSVVNGLRLEPERPQYSYSSPWTLDVNFLDEPLSSLDV